MNRAGFASNFLAEFVEKGHPKPEQTEDALPHDFRTIFTTNGQSLISTQKIRECSMCSTTAACDVFCVRGR